MTKTARRDLDAIYDYWAQRASPDIAGRLVYTITDRFPLIAESPEIGRTCDEIATSVRIFAAGKYLIYYRKGRGAVQILQILHGARNQA
ncbi:MAG: type II toxin-antitoxin system RelE/ParE family toxin [Terracidiphilus sp.]